MSTQGLETVFMDFEAPGVPDSVREYHPVVYKEGTDFCCILGPDPQTGIFGQGATIPEALADFDSHLKKLKENPIKGDPVSDFIEHRHI